MALSTVKQKAFANLDLLKTVIDFKMKFYPRAWAKYSEAIPGTLKLLPLEYRMSDLSKDYQNMKDMIYGNVPTFDEIISVIKKLEEEINALK